MSGAFDVIPSGSPRYDPANYGFDESDGRYVQTYERRRQPDLGGAHVFAYETYSLMEVTPIGPGVARRQQGMAPITIQGPMVVQENAGFTTGLPIISGEFYGQPLVDANGNLVQSLASDATNPMIAWNQAFCGNQPVAYGNPFPMGW